MKHKILHVINSMTVGGAETLLANSLAPGGLNEYADNYLVYFNGESYLLDVIDKNVKLIGLNFKGGLDVIRILNNLYSIIRGNKIDIVHTHLPMAHVYTHLVCPRSIPQVHTLHAIYSNSMNARPRPVILSAQKHLCFKRNNCEIICLSDFVEEDLLNYIPFKGKTHVVNNFVSDSFFANPVKTYNSDKAVLKLVAVGNLLESKNFEYLLEVFRYLKDQKIYLDIYGYGDKKKYDKKINDNNLKVRMMGGNNNIAEVLHKYDLFIIPSKHEGFGLTLFEAMASGLPVMASDIAAFKCLVKESVIYFDLNDSKATANTIKLIRRGEININNLAEKGKRYAEQLVRREIYIQKLLNIYNQLAIC